MLATMERILTVVGNKQCVANAIACVLTAAFSAFLLGVGVLSKLSPEAQLAWAVWAALPIWGLSSGVLDALGAGYVTDKDRQKTSGTRILFGAAKAMAALMVLGASGLYLWLA